MPVPEKPAPSEAKNSQGTECDGGELLSFGEVLKPRGTRGELKIRLLCADAQHFQQCVDTGKMLAWKITGTIPASSKTPSPASPPRPVQIEALRFHAGYALLKLAGIDTPEDAENFRAHLLGLRQEDIPPPSEGSFYHHELQGLSVVNAVGETLGKVQSLRESPGHDHLVVAPANNSKPTFLIPMVHAFVKKIDLESNQIQVDIPPGLIESQH